MSAREDIAAHFTSDVLADELLDAYRAEVLAEAADYFDQFPTNTARVLRGMADEGAAAEQTLRESREPVRPPLKSRLATLLAHIEEQGGEWTTKRVQRFYRGNGPSAPHRTTARKDLHALAAMGWLLLDETDPGRRCYRLNYAGSNRG